MLILLWHVPPTLNTVADQEHPCTLDSSGLFEQDNAPCHTAKMVQEWFEEHNNEFEVLTWSPNSQDLNPVEHLWHVLEKQV